MKELFTEPLTKDELEYLLYKFKTYLGSVSREIQNRRLADTPLVGVNSYGDAKCKS